LHKSTYIVALVSLWALTACGDSSTDPDETTLEFFDLRAEEIGSSRAVIRFTTSRPTSCEAEYGLAETALDQTAVDPAMGGDSLSFAHEVALEDLLPATLYFYRARATDEVGDAYRSQVLSFTTVAATAPLATTNYATAEGTTVAAVSSNFGGAANHETWGADHAVDGLQATEWATDGDGDDAWVELDFGSQRRLLRFEFRSRRMDDGSSIITSVQLVFDGSTVVGPFDTPSPDVLYGFDLQPPVSARTVRIEAVTTTGGNTGAREIRLLGLDD
jgi:hypothetical protein